MNQDLEEKRIRKLFHELRRENEGRAPAFNRVWEAALTGSRKPSRLVVGVAWATLSLILAVVLLVALRHSKQPDEVVSRETPPTVSDHAPPLPRVIGEPLPPLPHRGKARVARARTERLGFGHQEQGASLISQWRSPTDFLLRTPNDELLKTVPRFGESVFEMKATPPDRNN